MFFSFSNLYIQNWTVTLSVWLHDLTRLWAITAGQSISVGSVNSCSAVYVGSPHQSPVAWVGGMHVGKGKVYNTCMLQMQCQAKLWFCWVQITWSMLILINAFMASSNVWKLYISTSVSLDTSFVYSRINLFSRIFQCILVLPNSNFHLICMPFFSVLYSYCTVHWNKMSN